MNNFKFITTIIITLSSPIAACGCFNIMREEQEMIDAPQDQAPSFEEIFTAIAHKFIKLSTQEQKAATWLNDKASLSGPKTFVRVDPLAHTATVQFITDPHGFHQPLCDLGHQWSKSGFTKKENPFAIAQKDDRFVLGGDYSDRGPNSLETLMAMMIWYINNPKNVIALRGNHEYTGLSLSMDLLAQIREKISPQNTRPFIDLIAQIFEQLPSEYRVTWQDKDGKKNGIAYVHGGPNLGHNPTHLLAGEKNATHEWVPYASTLMVPGIHGTEIGKEIENSMKIESYNASAWTDIDHEKINSPVAFDGGRLRISYNLLKLHCEKSTPNDMTMHGYIRGHQQADPCVARHFTKTNGIASRLDPQPFQNKSETALDDFNKKPFVLTANTFYDYRETKNGGEEVTLNKNCPVLTLKLDPDNTKCTLHQSFIHARNYSFEKTMVAPTLKLCQE